WCQPRPSLGPNVVGFRRMDMGIIPAGRGQDVVVARGISYLSADVDLLPMDRRNGGFVKQAIDERGGWVLKNLLEGAGVRLRPVVGFHGGHEDRFCLGAIVPAGLSLG